MKTRIHSLVTALFLVAVLFSANKEVVAQTGTLDPTFDNDGMENIEIGGVDDRGYAVAIQADGKIVVVGRTDNGTDEDFAVVRFNTDGTLDVSFDTDGKVTTAIGSDDEQARAVAIQSDGKIVVAGHSFDGANDDFTVVRYLANGSLDNSFSTDGIVTTDVGISFSYGYAVKVQTDGKILVAGYATNGNNTDFALVKYNSDGTLDLTFSSDGMVLTDIDAFVDIAYAMEIQSDGKIVLVGYSYNGANNDFAVVRYNADGSLDNSFDTDGMLLTDFNAAEDIAYAVAIQSDEKIIVAGNNYENTNYDDFAMVRYNTNGSLDNSFDTDGKVSTDFVTFNDYGNAVAIQSNGKIIMAGSFNDDSQDDYGIVCYNIDGSLDTTFSGDGKVTTDFDGENDFAQCTIIQNDGKIVVAGYSQIGSSSKEFSIARYNADSAVSNFISSPIELPEAISVFPNPFNNELVIKRNTSNDTETHSAEVIIFDSIGKEISRHKILNRKTMINTENFASGFYMLKYIDGYNISYLKLVK